jgi:ABC-type hemin transport system ATPase subunit
MKPLSKSDPKSSWARTEWERQRRRACCLENFGPRPVRHDLNLATLFAERIVVLDRGHVAADGSPADTITDAILERVFKVSAGIGRMPAAGTPFVLPHAMTGASSLLR